MVLDQAEFERTVTRRLCLLAICGVLPFAVYWLLRGDWLMGPLLTGCVALIGAAWLWLHRGGSARQLKYALAAVYTTTAVLAIYRLGLSGAYWLYPLIVASYYLLPLRPAIGVNLIAILAAIPALLGTPDTARLLVTVLLTSVFGVVFSQLVQRQRLELRHMALLDPLTAVGNRRELELRLAEAVAKHRRYGTRYALLMLDLDRFKAVNDTLGHAVGDALLIEVTRLVNSRIRGSDTLFRYGGEEFVVLAPEASEDDAVALGEALRGAVEEARLLPDRELTLSVGVAELQEEQTVTAWLRRADAALYRAKAAGRNRVARADEADNVA